MPTNTDSFDFTLDDLVQVPYTSTIPVHNGGVGVGGFSASVLTTSGQVLTSNGMNGTSWTQPYNLSPNNVQIGTSGSLQINGTNADILVNGRSLCSAIDNIEARLAILRPNPELEKEWEELKSLGDQYRALESEIKEKMKVWDTLKRTDL